MATKQVKNSSKKGTTNKSSNRGRPPKSPNGSTNKKNSSYYKEQAKQKKVYHDEITLTVTLVLSLILILSNFNLGGKVGGWINSITFGLIGFIAYIVPFALFFLVAFHIANRGNKQARHRVHCVAGILITITGLIQLSTVTYGKTTSLAELYELSSTEKTGGGLVGGILSKLLVPAFGTVGAFIILLAATLILLMFITGKAVLSMLTKKGEIYFIERKERRLIEEEEYEAKVEAGLIEKRKARIIDLKQEPQSKANEKLGDNVAKTQEENSQVGNDLSTSMDSSKKGKKKKTEIVHGMTEILNKKKEMVEPVESHYESILEEKFGPVGNDTEEVRTIQPGREFNPSTIDDDIERLVKAATGRGALDMDNNSVNQEQEDFTINMSDVYDLFDDKNGQHTKEQQELDDVSYEGINELKPTSLDELPADDDYEDDYQADASNSVEEAVLGNSRHEVHQKAVSQKDMVDKALISEVSPIPLEKVEYKFPPLDLLSKPKASGKGVSEKDLKETAIKLQTTLESFGVRVQITNVSCGPAVTRYELQPEQGVKVSRITGLADDIKLNLAAADVRIEAPIPGKAAVGIEVPNKENTAVMFRELIDSKDFSSHSSNIAFAVGKDIGGQTMVTDIGKMPHLLIAGATGSGKSVCINTLIMSILYKANPEDVRMIMIDPKVVELSVYNGIPHLLIPVVTDPKKASAALNWAVVEMTERYNKFAELGVRDIKGYNEKIKTVEEYQDERYKKLPQIVIIVDELADLMMVAPGEVEDAICRLAQMARAAGLHLIIATQRPSVNVITGLIKANIPSRIAFSVSSAIDSRTIIDGSGAEKLLGKGDMLFFPSGYPKPVRVQGAFVSDKEVSSVVEFLKSQNSQPVYSEEVANQITSTASIDSSVAASSNERDEYFIEAGKFIIEKDKASIGMLQRVYKIGFNRAARIMDQLSEAGVVGPEEGTKPRKVIMSLEEFENYIDEYV